MAIQTGLEGKPWYYGLLVGLGVAVALFLLLNFWQFNNLKRQTQNQRTKLADLETKIQQGRAAQARLPQFRERVRRLELELDKLLRILPARLNTQEILRNVRTLAEQGDFQLTNFEPAQNLTNQDFYQEWPIKIELDGGYHNLAVFFDKIRRYPRIFNIENLQMDALREQDGTQTLSAEFTAKTFVYQEPVEEAPAPIQRGPRGAP